MIRWFIFSQVEDKKRREAVEKEKLRLEEEKEEKRLADQREKMQKDFEAEQQRQKNKEEEVSFMILKRIYFTTNPLKRLYKKYNLNSWLI